MENNAPDIKRTPKFCLHCLQMVDMIYQVGWENGKQFVSLGYGCEDCAAILKRRIDQVVSNIRSSRLN